MLVGHNTGKGRLLKVPTVLIYVWRPKNYADRQTSVDRLWKTRLGSRWSIRACVPFEGHSWNIASMQPGCSVTRRTQCSVETRGTLKLVKLKSKDQPTHWSFPCKTQLKELSVTFFNSPRPEAESVQSSYSKNQYFFPTVLLLLF